DMTWQPVEPLDELEEQIEPTVVEATCPKLGKLAQCASGMPCTDVRERFRDGVDVVGCESERSSDVTDRVAYAIGVHHRDAGASLAAVTVEDRFVDLGAASRLDVDV